MLLAQGILRQAIQHIKKAQVNVKETICVFS